MGPPHRPLPRPPGLAFQISQAAVRDSRLNPEEQEASDQALALLRAIARDGELNPAERGAARRPPVPGLPLVPAGALPVDYVAIYKPLLTGNRWTVEISDHPVRARLEAFHPSGAVIMITADRRRSSSYRYGSNMYLLRPPGNGRWRRLAPGVLPDIARDPSLRKGQGHAIETKCRCKKENYPTEARAAVALAEVQDKRDGEGERRFYRCEADDRVWHLTKKPDGYRHETPLADAYERADEYERSSLRRNRRRPGG